MDNNFLIINNLSKQYFENKIILNNLSYTFNKDEIIGIQGENGCGKTTLLRILATLTYPSSGNILLDNKSIKDIEKRHRPWIGWMPSGNIGFYSKLTGIENIIFFSNYYTINQKDLYLKINDWKKSPVFNEALKTRFYLSSTGMKNILLLFKAFMHEPKLLLLDEPLVSFDEQTIDFAINMIKKYAQQKLVIFTSHQNSDITQLATKSLTLKGGNFV